MSMTTRLPSDRSSTRSALPRMATVPPGTTTWAAGWSPNPKAQLARPDARLLLGAPGGVGLQHRAEVGEDPLPLPLPQPRMTRHALPLESSAALFASSSSRA